MANHPNRARQANVIYAHRIAGNLYDVTYSYAPADYDRMVPMAYIEREARRNHCIIEIDRSQHRGEGEAERETITKFA